MLRCSVIDIYMFPSSVSWFILVFLITHKKNSSTFSFLSVTCDISEDTKMLLQQVVLRTVRNMFSRERADNCRKAHDRSFSFRSCELFRKFNHCRLREELFKLYHQDSCIKFYLLQGRPLLVWIVFGRISSQKLSGSISKAFFRQRLEIFSRYFNNMRMLNIPSAQHMRDFNQIESKKSFIYISRIKPKWEEKNFAKLRQLLLLLLAQWNCFKKINNMFPP